MKKEVINHLGFEILESNGNEMTLKRVLKKPNNAKERLRKELQLPTLTICSFSEEELQIFRDIENELIGKIISGRKKICDTDYCILFSRTI